MGQVQSSLSPLSSAAEGASSDPTPEAAAAGKSFSPPCLCLQGERLTAGDVGGGQERNGRWGLCPALMIMGGT